MNTRHSEEAAGPGFNRIVKVRPHPPERYEVEARDAELARLAARAGVSAVLSLRADFALSEDGSDILAMGAMVADVVQPCAVSGEDFTMRVEEPLALRFVRQLQHIAPDEEVELASEEADEIEFDGQSIDLGEALAQSLILAIDPYAEGPHADAVRQEAGLDEPAIPRGPLADALAALKKN